MKVKLPLSPSTSFRQCIFGVEVQRENFGSSICPITDSRHSSLICNGSQGMRWNIFLSLYTGSRLHDGPKSYMETLDVSIDCFLPVRSIAYLSNVVSWQRISVSQLRV